MQRKREADRLKKEKKDAEKERERLRLEIQRDKEARRANKGLLPSVLGVDGYNPSAVQYEGDKDKSSTGGDSFPASTPVATASSVSSTKTDGRADGATAAKKVKIPSSGTASSSVAALENPEQTIQTALDTLSRYRTGGDGGQALKLLLTFLKNIVNNPDDPKYRSINTESNAYKTKLAGLIGPNSLLKAVGFVKNDDGKLVLERTDTMALLIRTADKLAAAEELYRQQNP